MLNLLLSPEAIKDLEKIYEYSFYSWGERRADKYQDNLYNGFKQICNHAEIGIGYDYSEIDYRKFLVNRHLIFYRFGVKDCIIVRILHERMDLLFELEQS